VETLPHLAPAPLEDDAVRRKWEAKQSDSRPLGAMERYRALNDAMDEAYDLFDLTNRDARFALILMGGLNAALVVFATRGEVVSRLTPTQGLITGIVLAAYIVLAFIFLLQAIQELRPGNIRPVTKADASGRFPVGVRYFEDVATRSVDEHVAAWNSVTIAQLNTELAAQVHSMCLRNVKRKEALRRLYDHLRLMTILLAVILVIVLSFTLIS
jgi:hypothetical protein